MYCSNCGKPVDAGSKFCKNCGSETTVSEKPNVETAQNLDINLEVSKNFKMNEEGVKALIKQNMGDDETESYCFYGVNQASFGKTMLLGAIATLSQKWFICNITNKGIHLYGLTQLGKPKNYSFVPKNTIKSVKVNRGFIGIGKVVEIEYNYKKGGKMKITVSKEFGIKEQGKKLEAIENLF